MPFWTEAEVGNTSTPASGLEGATKVSIGPTGRRIGEDEGAVVEVAAGYKNGYSTIRQWNDAWSLRLGFLQTHFPSVEIDLTPLQCQQLLRPQAGGDRHLDDRA
jgi:hypothetical protein